MTMSTDRNHANDRADGVADLIDFLDASPSPWHAVQSTIDRLDGFVRLDPPVVRLQPL